MQTTFFFLSLKGGSSIRVLACNYTAIKISPRKDCSLLSYNPRFHGPGNINLENHVDFFLPATLCSDPLGQVERSNGMGGTKEEKNGSNGMLKTLKN